MVHAKRETNNIKCLFPLIDCFIKQNIEGMDCILSEITLKYFPRMLGSAFFHYDRKIKTLSKSSS